MSTSAFHVPGSFALPHPERMTSALRIITTLSARDMIFFMFFLLMDFFGMVCQTHFIIKEDFCQAMSGKAIPKSSAALSLCPVRYR